MLITVRSAYRWLTKDHGLETSAGWNWIWKLPLPTSLCFFLWQGCHLALPVKEFLCQRGVLASNTCP
uniref:Reverse transcriptase zinc-binding domain-containing protein n=1 Tax=Cajanus cajan TaxID=3821 RepID=A0A151T2A9_CAJCA|nr:hypothetical protein KK1_023552 [Cajanus cajan]